MGKFERIRAGAGPARLGLVTLLVFCGASLDEASAQERLGLSCTPRLLAVPLEASESLTIRVRTAPTADLIVSLTMDNPNVASVPDRVTIRAGETSAPVTVTAMARGATFLTASTEAERATANLYVAPRLTGDVIRFPAHPVRVMVGPLPAEPTTAPPVRILVLPIPFAITQPVRVEVRNP